MPIRRLSSCLSFWLPLFMILFAGVCSSPMVYANYHIGPGDVLKIKVTGEPKLTGEFEVRGDQTIFMDYLKYVKAGSITVDEFRESLITLLKDGFIHSPNVNVSVARFASKKVTVLGAVKTPGLHTLRGTTTLLDLIPMVGDLTKDASGRIVIIRKQEDDSLTSPIIVNFSDITKRGDISKNVTLQAGDIVNVPLSDEIYVLGHVNKPGAVKFKDKLTLLEAITLAGGTSMTASPKSTYIIRKQTDGTTKKMPVRLDRVIDKREEGVALRADDVIVVPESFF